MKRPLVTRITLVDRGETRTFNLREGESWSWELEVWTRLGTDEVQMEARRPVRIEVRAESEGT